MHALLLLCLVFFFQLFVDWSTIFPSFWLLMLIMLYRLVFIRQFLFTPCIVFAISYYFFPVACHPRSDLHVVHCDYQWLEADSQVGVAKSVLMSNFCRLYVPCTAHNDFMERKAAISLLNVIFKAWRLYQS